MEYNRSNSKEKWTIMMYMRDFDLMVTYAYALRASNELSIENIDEILEKMERDGVYRPRNGGSTFTGQFKSIQIAWYMFGYYNKSRKKNEKKKLVFSPLGNLLLDNINNKEKKMKIFLAMLFGNGFRQPFSQMDERFNLYPFRLIFKLLRDSRLKGRLYNDEAFYLIMFLKTIERDSYEELVKDILNLRARDSYDKYIEFKEYERVLGLASHEWRYFTGMLESAGIVKINNENNNRIVGQFTYGSISKKTGRPNAVRKYTEDFITLSPELFNLVDNLLASYSVYDKPFSEEELSTKFNSSIVVDMYSFYPPELLDELGMNTKEDKAIASMLNIANGINYYSREETQGGNKFENILADAFNMFIDVEAERVGGSGRVDIECLYYISENNCTKFDIEAKARNKKLVSINSRRLKTHRIGIGSKYTIVVTPSYSIGVLRDIIDAENTVVIKSSTLANYFYQYIVKFGRELSYSTLDGIIVNNFGIDISDKVNSYVYDNFGYDANDLKLTSANVK
ncbi:hypothetical protein [Enterococcus cecorum]|uniref:hypothetical protein n=1 Tax=Enterococcus cecorum TaxID=44008 RepID=UPI00148C42E3|nr:hypothetical protein [Enterococcus cecorum]